MATKAELLKEVTDIETALGGSTLNADAALEVGQSIGRLRSMIEQTVKF